MSLHWQADSSPLDHQGSLSSTHFLSVCFSGVEFSLGCIDIPLHAVSFANILFHSVGDLFTLLIILFTVNIRFYFCLACLKGCIQKVLLIRLMSNCILPMFPSRTLWFRAIHLSLESFLHLLWGMVSKTSSV